MFRVTQHLNNPESWFFVPFYRVSIKTSNKIENTSSSILRLPLNIAWIFFQQLFVPLTKYYIIVKGPVLKWSVAYQSLAGMSPVPMILYYKQYNTSHIGISKLGLNQIFIVPTTTAVLVNVPTYCKFDIKDIKRYLIGTYIA